MYLSLNDAARQARVSRATLYKRNKEGKLSFHTTETGQKVIDTAELSRLYTLHDDATNRDTLKTEKPRGDIWHIKWQAAEEKIRLLERHLDHLHNTLQHEQNHVTTLLNTSEQRRLNQEQKPFSLKRKIKQIFGLD